MSKDDSMGDDQRNSDLSDRIEAAREAARDKPAESGASKYNALSLAWRMVIELVAGCGIGFAMGWGLDGLFGTKPLMMIIFGLLGFAAGAKVAIESAQKVGRGGSDETDRS